MQKELTNQAMALFDSPEKWNAFLDLVSEEESIKNWNVRIIPSRNDWILYFSYSRSFCRIQRSDAQKRFPLPAMRRSYTLPPRVLLLREVRCRETALRFIPLPQGSLF